MLQNDEIANEMNKCFINVAKHLTNQIRTQNEAEEAYF